MQYYIYENKELKEVSGETYDSWIRAEKDKFILPEYGIYRNNNFYGLETMYYGCVDKGEQALPFVLLYFEDITTIKDGKVEVDMEANSIDYFASFEELQTKYNEFLSKIKAIESISSPMEIPDLNTFRLLPQNLQDYWLLESGYKILTNPVTHQEKLIQPIETEILYIMPAGFIVIKHSLNAAEIPTLIDIPNDEEQRKYLEIPIIKNALNHFKGK